MDGMPREGRRPGAALSTDGRYAARDAKEMEILKNL
jgi:hypothetical protein